MSVPSASVKKGFQCSQFHRVREQELAQHFVKGLCDTLQLRDGGASIKPAKSSFFVPSLVSLCADTIAKNFVEITEVDSLASLNRDLYELVIERLSPELPLKVSVPRVHCEKYWRRCCETRWSFGQLSEGTQGKLVARGPHGWKQFFLERLLRDFLTSLKEPVLSKEDEHRLEELCVVSRDFVYSIELPCQVAHLDLYEAVLSRLPHVTSLSLSYSVCNVGISFEWDMIGFTEEDALSLRYILKRYAPLTSLRLPGNRLNSTLLKGIISGAVRNTSIKVLDFSCNRIDDDGVKSLALLLCKEDLPLEELYLNDNVICGAGAVAIGDALTMNKTLRVLNLRLNRIPDEDGGVSLIKGIASHTALKILDISHNILGEATSRALAEALPEQSSLLSLNVSGNKELGSTTGELLLEGLRKNKSLRFFDSRSSGLSPEHVAAMESHIRAVVHLDKMNDVHMKDAKAREMTQREVEEKLSKVISFH
uniref:Leucine-rich repeat protein (LRRP) n=1 Tax=Trypanosoma congolense (strain IL3000) TaxID=1068625 RepID=G0UMU0_TRYCI|nr:conserved hypothetical protein [Trypanosoma congolense IL3000]